MYNAALTAMVDSGADAQKNMFDTFITFPWNTDDEVIVSTRAKDFSVPEAATGTDERKYHGTSIKVPKTEITFDRKFSLTFRLDASYALYQQFITWHSITADPVSGGVSNWATSRGTVRVQALSGTYAATAVHSYEDTKSTYAIADAETNAEWTFFDVWPEKVGQPKFTGDAGGALDYTVEFNFYDTNYPYYNGGGIQGSSATN